MPDRNRRGLQWYTSQNTAFSTLSAAGQSNLPLYTTADVTATAMKGSTVTRTLVDITIAANAVAQRVALAWGLAVINGDAANAGVFPDPEDLSDRPGWLARGLIQTIQASLSDSSQEKQIRVDLRSQRILRAEEDEYHLIFTNVGVNTLKLSTYIRALIKYP